ncbi:hNH endonuclease [Escherichia coli]|uniref:hNH endonuclease n=1 Tax=Escherichia coli TaxID=562 RepID=UPI0010ABA1F3|nr:hNH endonuclease [Escherichia coli]EHX7084974.1 hNH endonuclease [Escherichia coli]ELS3292284.1 hNH endonuclease [Escherichia coli]TJM64377.1 hNH endonuclease [Escherichia coli]HCZ3633505.1 hNH endonuclease [Escherichia coli]
MKQMTLIEMDGFLKGKCIPGDLKVNETNAEYLVRKFGELESKLETALRECRSAGITIDNLEAKCAALTAENGRYSMSAGQADQRMAESRAVRSALGFQEDADDVSPSDLVEKIQSLITEQEILRSAHPQPLGPIMDLAIDAFNSAEMPETGMLNAFFILRDSIIVKTPATDAFLAEVRAQGVDAAIEAAKNLVAQEYEYKDFKAAQSDCCMHPGSDLVGKVEMTEWLVDFAAQLRKGGNQ